MNSQTTLYRNAIGNPMALCHSMNEKNPDGTDNLLYYYTRTSNHRLALDEIAKEHHQDIAYELIIFNSYIFNLLNDCILLFYFCCKSDINDESLSHQDFMKNLMLDLQHISDTKRLIKKHSKLLDQNNVALKYLNYFETVFEDTEDFLRTNFFIFIDRSPLKFQFEQIKASFQNALNLTIDINGRPAANPSKSVQQDVESHQFKLVSSDANIEDTHKDIWEAIEDHLCLVENYIIPANFNTLKEALFIYFTTGDFLKLNERIIFKKRCVKKVGRALGGVYQELNGNFFEDRYLLFIKNNINIFMNYPLDLNDRYKSLIYKYLTPGSTTK